MPRPNHQHICPQCHDQWDHRDAPQCSEIAMLCYRCIAKRLGQPAPLIEIAEGEWR